MVILHTSLTCDQVDTAIPQTIQSKYTVSIIGKHKGYLISCNNHYQDNLYGSKTFYRRLVRLLLASGKLRSLFLFLSVLSTCMRSSVKMAGP